jgi:transcriptional regulator GlxA family with amidase domain
MAVLEKIPSKLMLTTFASHPGPVESAFGVRLDAEHSYSDCPALDLLLVPGGPGTRAEIGNEQLLETIRHRVKQARVVLSVCTGSALLARAGVLDGRRATSNKRALRWVQDQSSEVEWVRRARWVEDGKFFTSSGVTAGVDAAFAVLSHLFGEGVAEDIARLLEYEHSTDPDHDPFALR